MLSQFVYMKKSTGKNNVTLSKDVLNVIDIFLDSDYAKERGLKSRPQVILKALGDFFDKHERTIELAKQRKISVKTIKKDSIILTDENFNDPILMDVIDNDNGDRILVCRHHADPDCIHRNFCLQNPDLWSFLERSNVKIVRLRP